MSASPEGTHLEPPTLLPCPFCGHPAFMAPPNDERAEWSIECAGYMKESNLVNCPGPTIEHADQAVALALWNRRVPRPFTKEELEALGVSILVIASGLNYPIHMPRYADDLKKTQAILRAMLDSSKGGD